MFENSENLIKESLENENDFSSATHVIDNLVAVDKPKAAEYEIPARYNKDTLRIVLVNTEKYFVYWEVSDKTLEEKGIDLTNEKIYFKVDDLDGNELYSFESSFALGDYYINKKFENIDILVKAGVVKYGEFIELLSSNVVHTFSSKVNFPSPEEYEELLKKGYSWTEIIRTTMEHFDKGTSSAKYVEELERLKHFIQEEAKGAVSSSSSHLGKSNG